MPPDKKSLSFLHYLQTAYVPDENKAQYLTEHLPLWAEQYKKVIQTLLDYVKKEKANSKLLKSSILSFSDELRIRLADHLPESDLHKIITEALLLSYLLKEKDWLKLIEKAHLPSLTEVVQQLKVQENENSSLRQLLEIHEEISSGLPEEIQEIVWQYLHHVQQYHAAYPLLFPKAGATLISYSSYLLKRKLGKSLNDQETQILWINTTENHWLQNLSNFLEPDLQTEAFADRIISCQMSLMDFGLAYQTYLKENQIFSQVEVPLYWQDPLNALGQGIQTSLFSPVKEESKIPGKLQENHFSLINLDLRQPLPPYRYARKSQQSLDQQIRSACQSVGIQEISIGHREHMLYWSLEKLGEQGIITAILDRKVLEEEQSQSFRRFMEHSFHEIYVLDMQAQEEGLAMLYLVKKSVSGKAPRANIQYAHFPLREVQQKSDTDFESLKWQKVNTDQQNYWIGLAESDFFDQYPLFGTEEAIFKSSKKGIETFIDEWLIDDDPKLLEKKVKFFLKQFAKASQKGKEEPSVDIKLPETLRQMAQNALSFDKQKIKKIQIKPFVYAFIYVEEKLMPQADILLPSIGYDSRLHQVFAFSQAWHTRFFDHMLAFPMRAHTLQGKSDDNISDAALKRFRSYYKLRSKDLDQTFIVFPPENITHILDKIESVSRDLPVIRKYPNQINQLLGEARHFTSDVELLTPPYEKIEEFKLKVLRLEKDAIERKVIYQRVKAYIEELKEQLASLTHEHDNVKEDLEAVNKENIFYYTYAVLHHPNYRQKYDIFLKRELPRIPMLPKFRQWVDWGKALFQAHQMNVEKVNLSALQVKEEKHESQLSKSFTYALDEAQGIIVLTEQYHQITLSNIPKEAWAYRFLNQSPFVFYLDYLTGKTRRSKKIKAQFTRSLLADKPQIIEHLKHLCRLNIQLVALENEMRKVLF